MNEDIKRGMFVYRQVAIMQHPDVEIPFLKLFSEKLPAQVLEIGTSQGGLTLLLRNLLDNLNLNNSVLRTYDIHESNFVKIHTNNNPKVEVLTKNIFNSSYNDLLEEEREEIFSFIKRPGVTVVLCDGGSKKDEFNLLSNFLKDGDIIMAHDYAPSKEYFLENIFEKVWNWHEIWDDEIAAACNINNLHPFFQEDFLKVAWVCKIKK